MIREDFIKIMDARFESIQQTFFKKNDEYAENNDVFRNFKNAGRKSDCTPERALMGMLLKHQVSLDDIINDLDKDKLCSEDMLNDKFGDIIVYHLLLEGMIRERIKINFNSH